jgi:CRISPR-associated protein Cas1
MSDRILDISDRLARLTARGGLLAIDFGKPWEKASRGDAPDSGADGASRVARDPESGLRARDTQTHTVPFADIAVLVTSHPQISFTQAVLAGLAAAGGLLIVSNEKHLPAAMMLPLSTHSTQTERFARQAAVSLPTRKRAWQQIVQAKLRAQARLLEEVSGEDRGLGTMAGKVRSGDPDNLEAQAARIYWQGLFGEERSGEPAEAFRRDPEGEGINLYLNYGYAVLRAIVARALCASGLHPSLGVHHHNRYDTFCLADDLMEPYRPLVDRVVARLHLKSENSNAQGARDASPAANQLDKDAKKAILEGLLVRYTGDGESRTLFDWASRSASSLVALIEDREEQLSFPALAPSGNEENAAA